MRFCVVLFRSMFIYKKDEECKCILRLFFDVLMYLALKMLKHLAPKNTNTLHKHAVYQILSALIWGL